MLGENPVRRSDGCDAASEPSCAATSRNSRPPGLGDRVLAVTAEVAETWAKLAAAAAPHAADPRRRDGLIAATALVHDLTLWTRNTRDFDGTGVRLFNPWED